MCRFIKLLIYYIMDKTLSGHWVVAYESLKTREKSTWVLNPKSGDCQYWSGRWRELLITKFKSQFKQGFTKVVVTFKSNLKESFDCIYDHSNY